MADGKRVTASDLELVEVGDLVPAATLKQARENVERELVEQALKKYSGRISSAATELGISRPTLYELMEKLGIGRSDSANDKKSVQVGSEGASGPHKM
jgi:two-component system NtrC family response regulator